MRFPVFLVAATFVANIGTVKITDQAENSEITAIENEENATEETYAEIKEFIANATERAMDWALAKGCEMVRDLQKSAKLRWTKADECEGQELEQEVARICDGQSKGKEAQNLGDQSALIATGQCILEKLKTEERQIENEQSAKGKKTLTQFDASIKKITKALPPGQLAKSGLANLVQSAKGKLKPSDLLTVFLADNKNNANTSESEENGIKKAKKTVKTVEKMNKLQGTEKKSKGSGALDHFTYMKVIIGLFLFGQISYKGVFLLFFLLPLILRPLNSK